MNQAAVHAYLIELQNRLVAELERIEGRGFRRDHWQRNEGGGGESCIIEDGAVFERGGVNFSRVQGERLPPSASAARPELAGRSFEALGVSLVLHPRNPYVPTVHMNIRFLLAIKPQSEPIWWFGGGMDMTPYYGFEEDARHFHSVCRRALAAFGADFYPRFKSACAEYFYLKHRGEPRGIGGGFFYWFYEEGIDFLVHVPARVWAPFFSAYLSLIERPEGFSFWRGGRGFPALL